MSSKNVSKTKDAVNAVREKESVREEEKKKEKGGYNINGINGLMGFESKAEKYVFVTILGAIFLMSMVVLYPQTFYPSAEGHAQGMAMGGSLQDKGAAGEISDNDAQETATAVSLKTAEHYYKMFKCSCCGSSIAEECCGMATQRKEYVDRLVAQGLQEEEIMYRMVKQFGFDVLMDSSREQEIRDYIKNSAPENPPKIEIENPRYDFGTINQKDGIVSTTFAVRNTGESDLVIENMDTSCMCTSATLTYNGVESPKFGMSMHGENPKDYRLVIPPGDSFVLTVYYDPMAHGIQKEPEMRITREVTIISNDPVDFQKKVRIGLVQVR